jgi:outer membrane protein insertion porin family
MSTKKRYRQLLLAAILGISVSLTGFAPASAADIAGKTVTAVKITGMSTVGENAVLAAVKTKVGDKADPETVKQDLQSIYEMGYFFDVVANFTEVPEGIQVVYTVMENPKLTDIVIKGNTKVSTEKIKSLLSIETGTVLNAKLLNDNMRAVEQYYHDQGFILAKVNDVAMGTGGVLTISVSEGVLEGITVKGNDKTKTNVITREVKLKTGEAFNVKDARRSMQKVYNLGYFEDVNMKLNPGKEPNAVVLETSVVEQKTGTFSIGAGYSKADGMVGIIELGDNNFRGSGDKVKVHWEFGGNGGNKNYEFGYTKPWLDDKQTSLGFTVYDMTNQYSDYEHGDLLSTYDKERQGWDITLGRPSGEYIQNYISFKHRKDTWIEQIDGVDYSKDEPYLSDDYIGKNFGLTRSVTLTRVFDSRDNVFNATEGKRYSLSAEFAGGFLGGEFDYNKYTAEARQYLKVGKEQVVALRMTAGYADGHMPESGKFAVGGSDTLRGYEDDEFKGDKMLTATAEYRFPVAKKVQGVVFTDIGNAWDGEGYKLDDLKASAGVGLRITTPIGPIRLDYAQGSEGGKTHFSFGGQF